MTIWGRAVRAWEKLDDASFRFGPFSGSEIINDEIRGAVAEERKANALLAVQAGAFAVATAIKKRGEA